MDFEYIYKKKKKERESICFVGEGNSQGTVSVKLVLQNVVLVHTCLSARKFEVDYEDMIVSYFCLFAFFILSLSLIFSPLTISFLLLFFLLLRNP